MRLSREVCCALGAALLLLPSCARVRIPEPVVAPAKDYYRPLAPGAPALRKVTDPARIPDFRAAFDVDRDALLRALELSIRYLRFPSSQRYYPIQGITHTRAAASLAAFRDLLTSARSGSEFHQRILAAFDVYESVGCDNEGTVLFTGYYTPIFDASLTPTSEYRWPLHRRPSDLVTDADGTCLGRRLAESLDSPSVTQQGAVPTLARGKADTGSQPALPGVVPYYSRAEIMGGALKGEELVYLKDEFEAYVCTVQGSARLRLPDGRWFKVGYHGNNGKEYNSVGLMLVAAGLLPRERLTLSGLMRFFRGNPAAMAEYLPRNERYVFFQQTNAEPTGSLGAPVTTNCTLATDKSIFPRACLVFVDTTVPSGPEDGTSRLRPFRRFMLDQDTGGGIRAAGRADIYLGIGERAGAIAGWTFSEGGLYYLFLKE